MLSVNRDIKYLKLFPISNCSFGGGKKPVSAIDTGIVHNICGVKVHVYYYKAKNALVYTPAGKHTSYSDQYEGPHHPMCKIYTYNDYIFNEGGIKWKGDEVVFSTEDLEKNDPELYNDTMLLGVIIACYHSLLQRLHYYIHLIGDLDRIIDYGHNSAPFHTQSILNNILSLCYDNTKECVKQFLKQKNLNVIMEIFTEIKFFSSDQSPERKKFIIEFYNSLMDGKPFTKKFKPVLIEGVSLKPKRLF